MDKPKGSYVPFLRQCFLTGSVVLNLTGHGCVIGFPAILNLSLRADPHIKATPSQESWIASIIGFSLILGSIIVAPMMDVLGRKKSHIISTIPIILGWLMVLLADSVPTIIAARFLQGISMGILTPLGSIIISETTDPKYRGAFLTCTSLSVTIGVMFTHTISTFLSWQQIALVCFVFAFMSLIMIIYTPETPSWLIAKQRYQESKEVFFWLRGKGPEQEDELEHMIISQNMIRKSSVKDQKLSIGTKTRSYFRYLKAVLKKPEFYKPVIIMIHIFSMMQFSGLNLLASYATDIIRHVVGPKANAVLLMVILSWERLICNILAVFLMQKFSRRTILFSMGAICVTAYLSQATYVKINSLPFNSTFLAMFLLGIHMFSLTAGLSSIPFAISGEIFPLEYRGLGSGISAVPMSLNFFIAVKFFPILSGAIGFSYTYYLYGGVVFYCLVVLWFMLPETKGRTLQDIEDELRGHSLKDADRKESERLN